MQDGTGALGPDEWLGVDGEGGQEEAIPHSTAPLVNIVAQAGLGMRAADGLHVAAGEVAHLERTVNFSFRDAKGLRETQKKFAISAPNESGDGTVPHRSGIAPKTHVKSIAQFSAEHEPAFKEGADLERIRHFTLRAIVQIAEEIKHTSLRYS